MMVKNLAEDYPVYKHVDEKYEILMRLKDVQQVLDLSA